MNFMGVKRSVEYFIGEERKALANAEAGPYSCATERPKVTDGEEYFEWLDVIEAIRAAQDSFTMIELGAGYGTRTVNAFVALQKLKPLPSKFVVVEGDPAHFAWAKDHALRNGLQPDQHWFINTLVSETGRPQLFASAPGRYSNMIVDEHAARIVRDLLADAGLLEQATLNLMNFGHMNAAIHLDDQVYDKPVNCTFLNALTLDTILQPLDFVDYMDVDIQFAERTVLPAAIDQINEKVRRLHVGTHSREIHAELQDLFEDYGWTAVFSFPNSARHDTPYGEFSTSDGILTMVNPRLTGRD
jgi:hypothetical protein